MTETAVETVEEIPGSTADLFVSVSSDVSGALAGLTGPSEVHCRHCGVPSDIDIGLTPDWLCVNCEHYQDAMPCPTCGQTVRISLMPAEIAPEIHEPARRRKAKE